jgi:hypothetical protein
LAAVYVELTTTRQAALRLHPIASDVEHSNNRASATPAIAAAGDR